MGNNPSKGNAPHSTSTSTSTPQSAASSPNPPRREPVRRGSVQALSTSSSSKATNVKATAAPPSASLEGTTATFARTTPKTHARSRSHTTGTIAIPPVRPYIQAPLAQAQAQLQVAEAEPSTPSRLSTMGNEHSKEKAPRDKSSRNSGLTPVSPVRRPSPLPAVSSQPLNVPQSNVNRLSQAENDPHATAPGQYIPPPTFHQPPRVPLPIAEEVHTPGSPIITPADLDAPVDQIEDVPLVRRASVLSSRTEDDDESVADDFLPNEQEGRNLVNTLLEWKGAGDKVYVTGTFADWERKFKLHTDGPSPTKDVLSTTIALAPGTHHLKFIVDGDMQINDNLPTTVDFTNSLVNYIEISPDDIGGEHAVAPEPSKSDSKAAIREESAQSAQHQPQKPDAPAGTKVPEAPEHSSKPAPVVPVATKEYHTDIPRYLEDLDAPEDSSRFARASEAIGNLPAPPTLPMFLNKSILNGQTPMKDDNSVLIMPNHTVLNHLATSSIRNGVLATSATTRYKRKFLTTIMYKSTEQLAK